MVQGVEALERQIATQREQLDANLAELKGEARKFFDWHAQFEAHPLVGLGLAMGGGAVVAAIVTPRAHDRRRVAYSAADASDAPGPMAMILREIGAALGAAVVTHVVDSLSGGARKR